MVRNIKQVLLIPFLLLGSVAFASQDLEFDAKRNGVELIGPYVKYNFLKAPFSFSQHEFAKSDIRLEFRTEVPGTPAPPAPTEAKQNTEGGEIAGAASTDPSAETPISGQARVHLYAVWPRYFLQAGKISLHGQKNETIYESSFGPKDTEDSGKFLFLKLPIDLAKHGQQLATGTHFCVEDKLPGSYVSICSDRLKNIDGKFTPLRESDDVKTLVNGKPVPTNAQINLGKKDTELELSVKFKSGLKIFITDQIRRVTIDQVSLNIKEKRIGIADNRSPSRRAELSFKESISKYLSEKNYFREELQRETNWPQELTDVEMEFAPYPEGSAIQLYGLSFDQIPSQKFDLQLEKNAPIATYGSEVIIKGLKSPEEGVFGVRKGALKVNKNQKEFLWKFQTPVKGVFNKDHIVYRQKENEKFYFSRRVYRGHQRSVAASASLASSLNLDIVPGFQLAADYWPETLYKRKPLTFQRWGFGIGKFQNLSNITVSGTTQEFGMDLTYLEMLGRFRPGVRPVESSFGMGLRVMNARFAREGQGQDQTQLEMNLLGIGVIWHTAPQKIVDDFFNFAPFFRYPKWMELALFYYPMTFTSGYQIGYAISYNARGRLLFHQNWFFDASINVNSIQFTAAISASEIPKLNISTAHGTIGFGYSF